MSPDIEDLLRSELRGAASGAPTHLGVDDRDMLARGRRVVVRRRVMTVAGVAAATLAIAGTIGVLAPRVSNDALPALPTPTVAPTPEVTPTRTSTATPSATVTLSASATASPTSTPTPSATGSSTERPSRTSTPSSTPSSTRTPSPSATPTTGLEWSEPISVGGVSYRARLVWTGDERTNYKAELRANGSLIYTRYDPNGEHGLQVKSDPTVVIGTYVGQLSDVISENDQPVSGEEFDTITLPVPDAEFNVSFTIIKLPRPATYNENGNVAKMVVRRTDGTESSLGVAFDY